MLRLLPLVMATFAVGTDGFVIAGLLPALGADLSVDPAVAGQLVTVFAVTVALAAPLLGWLAGSLDRRAALLCALTVFVLGNVLTALGKDFTQVMLARIVTAAGAGTITSSASATAAALSPAGRRGRALALVMGGLTLSTAIGLPLGTLIGRADWRLTLWAVSGVGALAALGVALFLPRVILPSAGLRRRLEPLGDRRVLGVLGVTVLAMAGPYLLYTYIATVLEEVAGSTATTLALVLLVWGAGVLGGTWVAGRLSDRFAPARVVLAALVVLTVALAVSPTLVGSLPTALLWLAVWGVAVGMPTVPQQKRLVEHDPTVAPFLLGLNSSAIYLGIAVGGGLGGLALHVFTAHLLGVPAAVVASLGVVLALLTRRDAGPAPERPKPYPSPATTGRAAPSTNPTPAEN